MNRFVFLPARIIEFPKGKNTTVTACRFSGRKRDVNGKGFQTRGDAVSTVGFELDKVCKYICAQNERDRHNKTDVIKDR
jgi:hypothetical protein